MPLTPFAADLDYLDYLAEERAAREAAELGPVCAGCGQFCGAEHFDVAADEPYCASCALQLTVHVANATVAEVAP